MKRRLVIIGIDGGTFEIIDPLVKKGRLPNLGRIINSGAKGILKSTYPPVTAAAWVSFMTGKNPGKHGFFDFREYNPAEYGPAFIPSIKKAVGENVYHLHSSRFCGKTIWDYLSRAGYELTVVAFPMTYPPWEINGRMVAGYPCPDYHSPKTFPPEWSREIGLLMDMSAINYSKPERFIRECKESVQRKSNIILEQMRNKRGNVFSVVFSASDFAQHFLWKYLKQPDHPYSSAIEDVYREIDRFLGEALSLQDNNTSIIVMSDHGFQSHPELFFNINSWLVQEKYIAVNPRKFSSNIISGLADTFVNQVSYRKPKWKLAIVERLTAMPQFVQNWASRKYFKTDLINWGKTRAFRFKMYATVEGIVINQKDRQKNGIVEKGEEYEKLRDEIINKLIQLRDPRTGNRIIAEAYKREEIYQGDYLENAPDIIVNFTPDYVAGVDFEGDFVCPVQKETTDMFSGIHSRDGIFIFCGPNVNRGITISPVNITDIFPTILYDLNLSIPADIDGKIIRESFSGTYKTKPPEYYEPGKEHEKTCESLSGEDAESVKEALKELGYL